MGQQVVWVWNAVRHSVRLMPAGCSARRSAARWKASLTFPTTSTGILRRDPTAAVSHTRFAFFLDQDEPTQEIRDNANAYFSHAPWNGGEVVSGAG